MSNTDSTKTAARATVPQILADLLVLGHENALPDPLAMEANGESGMACIKLISHEQLSAWNRALGGNQPVRSQPYSFQSGIWLHSASPGDRKGWYLHLSALTPDEPLSQPLDAEAALTLATIAAEMPQESAPVLRAHRRVGGSKYPDGTTRMECSCGTVYDGVHPYDLPGVLAHFGAADGSTAPQLELELYPDECPTCGPGCSCDIARPVVMWQRKTPGVRPAVSL